MVTGDARGAARRLLPLVLVAATLLSGCTAIAPTPPVSDLAPRPVWTRVDPISDYADDRLSTMSLDERIRSMFMVHLAGTNAGALSSYAAGTGAGGLILMGDNIPEQEGDLAGLAAQITGDPGLPILLGIDQEGGVVRRLFSDEAASAEQLRALPPAAATEAFAARAALLVSAGVTVNFGIVADVTGDTSSFIYDRSMGSTPATAAERVAAAVAGEQGAVLSTLKHFPGHGVAPGDSHSSIPATGMGLEQWSAEHAEPFRAGIAAGAELVMVGHLQFDAVDPQPATLSPVWNGILRDDLGFDGIIVTDDMGMLQNSGRADLSDPASNAIRAIAAGSTLLLYVGPVDLTAMSAAVQSAIDAGAISVEQIDDAARRLLELRRTLSGETGPFVRCFAECQAIIQ
jgi:beta-N-acetylhexosaminidase